MCSWNQSEGAVEEGNLSLASLISENCTPLLAELKLSVILKLPFEDFLKQPNSRINFIFGFQNRAGFIEDQIAGFTVDCRLHLVSGPSLFLLGAEANQGAFLVCSFTAA